MAGARSGLPADDRLGPFVAPLVSLSLEVAARAAIAAARAVLPKCERAFPDDARPRQALQAAMEWVRCPCKSHVSAALAQGSAANRSVGRHPRACHAARAAAKCALLLGSSRVVEAVFSAEEAGFTRAELRETIRAALVPWLLNDGDPLADWNASP